jgi:putative component of toxin-antitoxin plasmid stabilization module
MTIELLYFDGCPNYERFLPHLRELLERAGIAQKMRRREVSSPQDAIAERFLGSPTLRIDGVDVEPGAEVRIDFGLKCRLYRTESGLVVVPPDALVTRALRLSVHQCS